MYYNVDQVITPPVYIKGCNSIFQIGVILNSVIHFGPEYERGKQGLRIDCMINQCLMYECTRDECTNVRGMNVQMYEGRMYECTRDECTNVQGMNVRMYKG